MTVKAMFLLSIVAFILLCDRAALRQAGRRTLLVYCLLFLPAAYLGLLFVTELPWPNLDELLRYLFGGAANQFVAFLKGGN